ncbi:MAG TPA: TldD/PmbA family protein [Thermodesulfobacteriota bacterium]|nr:TldD/PmbA family protein [Thermodesulfobacteriota bacterium]
MDGADKIIDQALSILKKKPIDGYEVYLLQSSHFDVESKEEKIESLQASQYLGMAFRILRHQRMGFSYATFSDSPPSAGQNFSRELDRIIEDAVRSSEATSADLCFDFAPCLKAPPAPLPIFDETLERISEKAKIERAKSLEAAAKSVDSEKIKKVRKASYGEVLSRATLVNSNGLESSYDHSLASVSVTAVAEEGGDSEMGWDFDFSHFFNQLDVESVGRSAGTKALERLGGRRIPSGVYPVLLRNNVAAEFLSLVAHSFLTDQVQKGKSPLKGKRGERFFSPLLTIVDDGLYAKGISTAPVDGEGVPSQRTPLVGQGVVTGYLYDRYWANRENQSSAGSGVGSTGNSRRHGIKSPPGVGISNFFIEPGELDPPKLMESLSRGMAVEEVMGLHTVDPISGDFSLGCTGKWVERGERVHPVKSIAIAGNLFELFRKVIGVGRDLRFFGGVGSPTLLVEKLLISGN